MPRILFVKTSSLGDVVHQCPAASDAARGIPQARIDWVVEDAFAGVARMHANVARVIPVAVRRWRSALWRPAVWREIAAFRRSLQGERYDAIVAQLNERARTLFMQGPGSDLEFLLGASSFTDLTDRLEYVNVVATNDADLATEVQNTKNVLSEKAKDLEVLRAAHLIDLG